MQRVMLGEAAQPQRAKQRTTTKDAKPCHQTFQQQRRGKKGEVPELGLDRAEQRASVGSEEWMEGQLR